MAYAKCHRCSENSWTCIRLRSKLYALTPVCHEHTPADRQKDRFGTHYSDEG